MADSTLQTPSGGGFTEVHEMLDRFWDGVAEEIRGMNLFLTLHPQAEFKTQELPLARIKKIMKLDEDVKMISAEAPVLFAKAAEIFITELSLRAWLHTEDNKRRTLQRNDIAMAITKFDQFDFLIDIVPRDELKPSVHHSTGKRQDDTSSRAAMLPDQVQYYFNLAQQTQQALQQQTQQAPAQVQLVVQPNTVQTVTPTTANATASTPVVVQNTIAETSTQGQTIQVQQPSQVQQSASQNQVLSAGGGSGGIQIIQQVVGSNGEIQNIPIQLTPAQLQLIRMQMQGGGTNQPIVIQTQQVQQAEQQPVVQVSQTPQSAQTGQTVYQIQHVGGATSITPQTNSSNGHQLFITAAQSADEESGTPEQIVHMKNHIFAYAIAMRVVTQIIAMTMYKWITQKCYVSFTTLIHHILRSSVMSCNCTTIMPKRRRQSPCEDFENGGAKRRRNIDYDVIEVCQDLYDIIRNHKMEDGRLLCDSFIRAPNKRSLADYYDVISTPMDLIKIQQKLKTEEYEGVDQMTMDVELMVSNAKAYYKKHTQEHKDAISIWELYCQSKNYILNAEISNDDDKESLKSSTSSIRDDSLGISEYAEDDSPLEDLFSAVMSAVDHENRSLSNMFQLLPSRNKYPDYYKLIEEPTDLKTVATKIQNGEYLTLADIERDLLLIVKNAKRYNEPGSQIYKDAIALRKVITSKKIEIEHGRSISAKTSERIRAKRQAGSGHHWSSIVAALQYDEDNEDSKSKIDYMSMTMEDEEGNDSEPEDADTNPQWQLFESVKTHTNTAGYQLSEPFTRLPSKKSYPDYYKEIKMPVSMNNVKAKIKNAQYISLADVVDEMNLMFENAKKYNRPDSRIYKDAVKLQKFMQAKAKELFNQDSLKFTLEERKFVIKRYWNHKNSADVIRQWQETHKTPPPPQHTIYQIRDKFNETGSVVDTQRSGRPITTCTEDDKHLVAQSVIQSPQSQQGGAGSDSEGESIDGTGKRKTPKKLGIIPIKKTPIKTEDSLMKRRLKVLFKTLMDFVDESGRNIIVPFMEKPLRKDYPDYYDVISDPIDMKSIEVNIRNDKYTSQESFLTDIRRMFNNCRQYNEEGSQIYRDANTLEGVLLDKVKDTGAMEESPKYGKLSVKKVRAKPIGDLILKLKKLYDTIRDFAVKGRKLSSIFMKLPSKTDYPDYYEVIKRPIDMQRIQTRLQATQYESLEDMLADFVLMFDNACKYNEPDSQIYKDALTLQRVALQTKLELINDSEGIPDAQALVQELLTNLFISVYNHQDEESRCYSDSLVELAELGSVALNLDTIKKNLNRNQYRRLDRFQEDMFEVFERARKISRTDSQAFEDSIELQSFFIKIRDELCRNGELLLSPAFSYTEKHLLNSVEKLKVEKLPQEEKEMDEPEKTGKESENKENSMDFKENTYRIGDFVYIEPRDKGLEPHIIHLERFSKDNTGEVWIYGCWFYRPNETFHLATRKFLQQEVFKSDNYNGALLSQIIGKCYVMFVKEYFKLCPEGFEDNDVYVCESRYATKAKSFKKIKIWPITESTVNLVNREEILTPVRVPSVFKEGVVKVKEQPIDNEEGPFLVLDKIRPNVEMEILNAKEGCTYFEQYNIPAGCFKLGDTVLVRTESGKHLIGRVDQMWVDKNSGAYFHGPWFVTPQEVQHPPTRLFYKQEVFLSSIEDTNPLLSIVGKCSVLDLKDYTSRRLTEVPENDVFVCESRYMEAERQIRKLPKGLKKPPLSSKVTDDEVYFFRKHIQPPRESSPFLPRVLSDYEAEDSNELPPMTTMVPEEVAVVTPAPTPVVKKKTQKQKVTGYIMYASEVRKTVSAANPDSSFGDVSRLVGLEWKNLTLADKGIYEEKAQRQNEENANKALDLEGANHQPQSPASASHTPSQPVEKHEHTIYECQWDGCDIQFEDQQDLYDHVMGETTGHIHITYQKNKDSEFQCRWHNCSRLKKAMPPFPNMPRLVRHIKDVHVKVSGKVVPPEQRNKNFVPSSKLMRSPDSSRPMTPQQTNIANSMPHQVSGFTPSSQPSIIYTPTIHQAPVHLPRRLEGAVINTVDYNKPTEPLFVPVPPKPQRLVHTEAYISKKYISIALFEIVLVVAMVLGVIAEHSLPLSMAPVLIGLSKKLAKDSKALTKLSLDRTTAAYKLRFGLADTMLARTIENIKQVPFSLNMDESTSKTLLRVFTILVSYYSDSSHEVVVEHLASVSLIKVASAPLFEQITGLFDKYNLPWENLMSVLMDSCNVMRGSKTGLEVRLREKASHLLDIDGDSCHHIHNCSKKFCEPFEKAVEKLHTDIYNDFKWSADLMDALKEICMILEVKFTKPDRFLGHRWLSCYDVTLANLRLMDAYLMFYYSFIPKESKPLYHHVVVSIFHSKEASNQSRMRIRVIQEELSRKSLTEDGRKRKNRIVEKLFYKRKQIITILHFYSAVLAMLKQYVCLFELKKPMIHKLYDRQAELFQEFLGLFIKPEELEHKTLKQLKEMDIDKADLLSKKSMFIGFSTEKALQQLDEISAGQFLTKAQTAFKACAGYMQKKLPLTNATLRRLSAIDPTAVGHSLTLLHLKKLPKTFPTVLNMSERQSYDREVHAFQLDCNLPPAHHLDETPVQLDHWWRDVIKMGKYPALTKMAKAIMSCFHGPLVESSFNLMQDILDTRSGRMKIETFNAFQTVKYSITAQKKSSLELFDRQDILRDPVNTTLCNNLQESWKRYKEEKENKRKVIEQKKAAYALKAAKLESKQKSKVAQQLVEKKARMAFIQKRQNNLKRKANLEALVANKKTKRTL
ncbi:Protein polybromo-1 [Nymphon striatum]|nr:Protein polybromo-1 [Nymphon striatum]